MKIAIPSLRRASSRAQPYCDPTLDGVHRTCYDACGRKRSEIWASYGGGGYSWYGDSTNPESDPDFNQPCDSPAGVVSVPPERQPLLLLPQKAVKCDPWKFDSTAKFKARWTRFCHDKCGRKAKQVVRNGRTENVVQKGWGQDCPGENSKEEKLLNQLNDIQAKMVALRNEKFKFAHAVTPTATPEGGVIWTTDDGINTLMSLREDARDPTRFSPVPKNVKRDWKELKQFKKELISLIFRRLEIINKLGIPQFDVPQETKNNGYKWYMESQNDTSGVGYVAANQLFWLFSNSIDQMMLETAADTKRDFSAWWSAVSGKGMKGLGEPLDTSTWLWIMAGAAGLYLLANAKTDLGSR